MASYHNTNREEGATLAASEKKAATQELKILQFMVMHPGQGFTPDQIARSVDFGGRVLPPLTSVRRAITNLTYDGHIQKTSKMAQGNYGKPVHLWMFTGV